ncbi:hypothetical protein QAD02_019507 [Eretmocerus hayati]|uniref:Uncharacterized protein n=1 Tax=Eretmocerus hayati TaxID=131215 RepID=A0ACC2PPK1_9HYME|nr:hypothetical protein QAD02_019507 [Eretmocerus hayati]
MEPVIRDIALLRLFDGNDIDSSSSDESSENESENNSDYDSETEYSGEAEDTDSEDPRMYDADSSDDDSDSEDDSSDIWEERSGGSDESVSVDDDSSYHTSVHSIEDLCDANVYDNGYDSDDSDDIGTNLSTTLVTSIKLERLSSTLSSVQDGADVSHRKNNQIPPLHYAIKWGDDTTVSAVLKAGVNPNLLYNGRTALLISVVSNKLNMAKVLLNAGASVHLHYQKSIKGRSLLHRAALLKHSMAMIDLLLDHGADVNAKDHQGESVLCYAANNKFVKSSLKKNHDEYVNRLELLIFRGAMMFNDGPDGKHSSFEAVLQHGPLDAVKLFISDKVKLENFRDLPLLHLAVANPFREVLEFLLETNIFDIEMRNSKSRTVLHEALKININYPDDLELLLRYGANPNALDASGHSPILVALDINRIKIIQQLLEYGARLNNETMMQIEFDSNEFSIRSLNTIIAQLALLEGQDHDFDAKARSLIDDIRFKSFYKSCKEEIVHLMNSVVYEEFTYYNLLVSQNIYRIVDNELIKNAFENPKLIREKFPIYGKRINRHFARLQVKLGALKGLCLLIHLDIYAFHHIYHRILQHLRPVDLQTLMRVSSCVKPLHSSN